MLKNFKEFKLPQIEEKVLANWKGNQVFKKLQERKSKKGYFRFYEGPPYANGHPGIHHILSRVFKDIILRYKSMAGYSVPRRAGWDTHGLPIEIQVEKELGIKSKREIDNLGIEFFNKKAREIIWRYLDEWERFTLRIGYWLDFKSAYITCDNSYVESLWWIFKRIHERGYLKESRKVVPYCPRCETPLSSHELGQPGVYQLTKDPSVYVKFKLKTKKSKEMQEYLLVWTTTPWTLPSNIAVAVDPQLTYTKYKIGNEYLWTYNPPPRLPNEAEVAEKLSGKKLVGLEYEPLYKTLPQEVSLATIEKAYKVIAADFIKTEEGTGMVHISPAFGEDDFNLLGSIDFPITVDNQGRVTKGLPGANKFIKDADKDISLDLLRRGLLYSEDKIEHDYPFCWRCSAPLIYFARVGWFFEMSRLRSKLLSENEKINWIPSYIKHGRFGEWLKDAKDWSISRDRYWGTPLPIWRCDDCKRVKVVGSLDELEKSAYHKNKFFILRHGEADHNVKDLIAAGPEKDNRVSHLTEKGEKQILAAAKTLKREKISIIFTSPYRRTVDTAKIVAHELGATVIVDKRLKEVDCGTFNWRKVSEHKSFFAYPLEEFTKAPPSGETLDGVRARVFDFIKDVNNRYKDMNILVVGHGDPLWMLEGAAKNLSREEALKLSYIDVGELREIDFKNLPYNDAGEVDVHRPYIDQVYLKCEECGGSMKRITDVADVWFDSGAMPLAAVHYPFANKKFIDSGEGYPADFIAEGIDQTRGWFYTMLALAVLLEKSAPYKNVISLGLIRDKYGQKMSKSKGNVVNPSEMIDKYGVDAIRWYFFTVNQPADFKDFDEEGLAKALRQFFLVIYNSYVFYESAEAGSLRGEAGGDNPKKLHVMDRWILARTNETIEETTVNLEKYDIGAAARSIEELVQDLSRWYIRRSRRRLGAKRVLGEVLIEISKLSAPFVPFFADAVYQSLKTKDSVHLAEWPKADKKLIDKELLDAMREGRKLAALALAKRSEAGIKVRQPLRLLKLRTENKFLKTNIELIEVLKEEVNVKEIEFEIEKGQSNFRTLLKTLNIFVSDNARVSNEVFLDTEITPKLKEEGAIREFTRLIQDLRKKAGLKPKDKIALFIETTVYELTLQNYLKLLCNEVGASTAEFKHTTKFDAEWSGKVDSSPVWIALRRI